MKHKPDPLLAPLTSLPEPLLLGISGGRDSVTLLHALIAAGRNPVLLHFNHRWRPESTQDAQFIRNLAKQHKLKAIIGHTKPGTAKTESEARRERHAFFTRQARRLKIPHLILAHHADDQVETLLLQLLRGTGSAWGGMAAERNTETLTLHRPWLTHWQKEIAAYATLKKLSWREDTTNTDPNPLRNRLRLKLIPLLETEYEPAIRHRLLRLADILRADQEWTESLVATAARQEKLPLTELKGKPIGHQRRLLRAWLQHLHITDLSFEDIEAARSLVENIRPAKVNLSRGRHLRRQAGSLFVE